jgi:hypothetical protein
MALVVQVGFDAEARQWRLRVNRSEQTAPGGPTRPGVGLAVAEGFDGVLTTT